MSKEKKELIITLDLTLSFPAVVKNGTEKLTFDEAVFEIAEITAIKEGGFPEKDYEKLSEEDARIYDVVVSEAYSQLREVALWEDYMLLREGKDKSLKLHKIISLKLLEMAKEKFGEHPEITKWEEKLKKELGVDGFSFEEFRKIRDERIDSYNRAVQKKLQQSS